MTDPDFRAAGRPEERAPDGDGRRRRLRAARAAYLEDASLRVVLLAATTLGLAYAFWLFDWGFIAGTGDYWNFPQRDDMDRAQALIGWRYFAQDAWRFPLFAVPSLSYPEGTRIVFTDSIPLFAAVFKLVFQLTGWQFNYFGFWMLLCYVLQATCAALLLYELGVRAWPANLLGTAIGLCSTILLERYPHAALCGHFIVLLSLWCYFAGVRNPRRRGTWPLQVVLLATSVWVSVYLTAMIGVVLAAMVLELVRTRNISARKAGAMLVTSVALMAGVMLAGGLIGPGSPSPAGGGFGNYSMNLLGPFFGDATSLMQRWLGPVPLDATGFQYEGFSYLGAGVLALAAGALTVGFRDSAGAMRSHPMLSLALVSLLLFSLSHRIHAGNVLLAAYPLPEVVTKLAGTSGPA